MKALIAAILLSSVAAQALAADPAALCQRLAAHARTLKDSAWGARAEDALQPALQINAMKRSPSPFEAALVQVQGVKQAIGDQDGQDAISSDHLAGTDLYALSTIQGTLHCQSSAYLKAAKGQAPRMIAAPMAAQDGDGLCWTQSGAFGSLYGQPAFIAHGTVNDHVFDTMIAVTPWVNGAWAQGCEVDLKFRARQRLVEAHCDDQAFCRAADDAARGAAVSYDAYRLNDAANAKLKDARFRFGTPAPPAVEASAQQAAKAGAGQTPAFPRFGVKTQGGDPGGFSNTGLEVFPMSLNGQWYIAAIGHDGVGWRESNRTLLAIYSEQEGALTPKAGFVFDAVNGGLTSADAKALPPPAR